MTAPSSTAYPTTPLAIQRRCAYLIGILLDPERTEEEVQKARIEHLHLQANRAAQMKRGPRRTRRNP